MSAALMSLTCIAAPATTQVLTWLDMNGALVQPITCLAVDPAGVVYASDDSGKVLRAEINGQDWSKIGSWAPPPSSAIPSILIHPSGKFFAVAGQLVYASTDGGLHWSVTRSWTRVGRTIGCTANGTILVGCTSVSMLRSVDAGGTWTVLSLPPGANEPAFLAYDAGNTFAATALGVYRSQDDGSTWSPAGDFPASVPTRQLSRDAQGVLFSASDSGLYVSADSGSHWIRHSSIPAVSVQSTGGITLFAGSSGGEIHRTSDAGLTWSWTGAVVDVVRRGLGVHPQWGFLAGTTSGIFMSSDSGAHWTRLARGLEGRSITAIASLAGRTVAAVRDSGLFSAIGDAAWIRSLSAPPSTGVQTIVGISWSDFYAGGIGTGVLRTRDGGSTWSASNTSLPGNDVFAFAVQGFDTLLAGTSQGVYRSIDSGATWTQLGSGLPSATVRSIGVGHNGTVYAGTQGNGVFCSTNNGNTWSAAGLAGQDVRGLAVGLADNQIHAGTASAGVYSSTDFGNTWHAAASGPTDPHVFSLVRNSEGDIFAGTPTGIFRSTDNGASWALQSSGFPLSPAVTLSISTDDYLFAGTDGGGVVRALSVTPTPPPEPIFRWMSIGSLRNWFSSMGCEIEVGRNPSADMQDGWAWPAQYPRQDMQASKGLWIGTTNYRDIRGRVFGRKVVHVGPRSKGTGEFVPVSMKCIDRLPRSLVTVLGSVSSDPAGVGVDSVSPTIPMDRLITNTVNTSIGITMTRRILQSSEQRNDNYILQEYTFTNTGNIDADPTPEYPGVTLDSVYFYFLYRWGICADTRYVIGNSTSWGINTMLDTRGDGVMTDPAGEQFRAQIAWHGKFPPFTTYDNIGAPIWIPYYDKSDTTGRLGGAQFNGVVTLHADRSAADSTDDPAQPATTSWEGSDEEVTTANSETDTTKMNKEFAWILRGHKSPRHAWQVEPGGNFTQPNGNPALGTPGGFSATNGYGPYRLRSGESVRIVVAEASAGLSREKAVSVGRRFRQGTISAAAKNDSVFTGRDSLFQTFRRAQGAYLRGYSTPRPPDPPKTFTVSGTGGGIQLSWDVYAEQDPERKGFRIYRSPGSYNGDFSLLASLPPTGRSFLDSTIAPIQMYYYYITSFNDSLESGRFYTLTYHPAWVRSLSVDEQGNTIPTTYALEQNYPNPFNPTTVVRFQLPVFSHVKLAVYDLLGREVAVLVNETKGPGTYEVKFSAAGGSAPDRWRAGASGGDAAGLASGVYLYRLTAGTYVQTKKMIVTK